jgi:signal transduction histidine kinase
LPDKEHQPRKEGIGLTNTRARLAHLYGSTHCFGLSSVPGGGLEVRIQIPYRTTPQVLSPPQAVVAVGQPCCTPAPTGAERS